MQWMYMSQRPELLYTYIPTPAVIGGLAEGLETQGLGYVRQRHLGPINDPPEVAEPPRGFSDARLHRLVHDCLPHLPGGRQGRQMLST